MQLLIFVREYINGDLSHLFSYICKFLFLSISHLIIIFEMSTCFTSQLSLYFNVTLCILHLFHYRHHTFI